MRHFLDTYALVEIVNGNPRYEGVLDEPGTSLYNLFELHVQIARLADEGTADDAFQAFRGVVHDVTDDDVLVASRFKREHRKSRFGYADALGYAMAQKRGALFVTGDKAFEGFEGVRFIRARE